MRRRELEARVAELEEAVANLIQLKASRTELRELERKQAPIHTFYTNPSYTTWTATPAPPASAGNPSRYIP